MFDNLFGWRKASKCKKLIGRVQCRLKLLKNKRSCIARQLREDFCQLLRDGHHQLVFDRVEQLFMDENLVAIYELLDNFCEFIIINLPYIRKHKDCPNDINEAVSTLIYSSARLGDLPELLEIRKLFGERYGQRFATVALDLLPGNLVNIQIKENLSIRLVSDDMKSRLVDEISRSCFQHGPLLLGYTSEWQKQEQVPSTQNSDNIHVSIPADKQDSGLGEKNTIFPPAISSSESFGKLQEEMVYLDDIAEFKSKVRKDSNLQDQRLFMFNPSSDHPTREILKGSRKTRKSKRTISNSSMTDIQTAIYYGKTVNQMKSLVKKSHKSYHAADEPCIFTFIVYSKATPEALALAKHIVSNDQNENESGGMASAEESFNSSSSSDRKRKQPPYIRAVTMPPERPKESVVLDSISRSNSFPVQKPDHVHPKLPDYDEISAKFMALKREKNPE